MPDKPILFSAPNVRAIIREINFPGSGKIQTRRIARWTNVEPGLNLAFSNLEAVRLRTDGTPDGVWTLSSRGGSVGAWQERARLRTFHEGDRLWVRETWKWDGADSIGDATRDFEDAMGPRLGPMFYKADDPFCGPSKWWPGIHMPRWASRITLDVTKVRVQRLRDISEDDARAEGADRLVMDDDCKFYEHPDGTYRTGFAGLWQHINGKRAGCSWDDNPWVVAVTFRPALNNIDIADELE